MNLTIGSLFSGVGGLELGLEWAGLGRTVWQVEQDEFCRQVLAKHWPDVDRSVTDVRCAGAATLVPVDVICGGFPCQDVSGAGKGAGLDGARSGLWWEYLRIVEEMRPRIVIVENVAGGAKRWLCAVRGALHELGYRTRAMGVAARDVGAPQRRERIFVVAYTDGLRGVEPEGREREQRRRSEDSRAPGGWSDVAYTDGDGVRVESGRRSGTSWPEAAEPERCGSGVGDPGGARRSRPGWLRVHDQRQGATPEPGGRLWQVEPRLGGGAHGLPAGVDRHRWPAARGEAQHEAEPPRTVADRPPWRRQRLRALGNAVVPQCAYVVGLVARQILEQE